MLQTLTDLDLRQSTSLSSTLWAALEKIGSKQKQHTALDEGSSHQINLQITGDVDGRRFCETISSVVSVGHDQMKTTSATPQVAELIAFILSKLNRVTREHLLSEVPVEFAENNQTIPEVDEAIVRASSDLLAKLRSAKQIHARRPVRCQYVLDN